MFDINKVQAEAEREIAEEKEKKAKVKIKDKLREREAAKKVLANVERELDDPLGAIQQLFDGMDGARRFWSRSKFRVHRIHLGSSHVHAEVDRRGGGY